MVLQYILLLVPKKYFKNPLYLMQHFIRAAHVKPKRIHWKGLHLAGNKNIAHRFLNSIFKNVISL